MSRSDFSGSANDWGSDATTYQWDWENDGTYDTTGQNPSHTWPNVGSYTVGLKVTDSQGGEGTATVGVTVGAIPVTVTADFGQSKIYGAADPTFTYTPSDPSVTFTGALSRAPGENVGAYAITLGTLSAGSNYAITFVPANFTITAKSITITPNDGQSKVYGAADPTFTYTAAPALETGDSFSGALGRVAGENVGTYAFTLGTLSAGANYSLVLNLGHTFAITAKLITITPNDGQSKVYGAADPTFSYTAAPALETGDSFAGALGRLAGENVGSYAFTLGTLSAGANYSLVLDLGHTFAITAKSITITPNDGQSKVYSAADPTFSYTAAPALETGDSFAGALGRSAGENVGTYAFTLGTLSAGANYSLVLDPGHTFAITAKSITITPNDGQSKVYSAADPTFSYTAAPALETGDSFAGALGRSAGENVGTYAFTLGTLSAGANYLLVLDPGHTFAITAKSITITPNDGQSKVYGAADPTFTYTAAPALETGDSFSGALGRVAGENVGTYAFTLGTLSAGANYSLVLDPGHTFAINKATATITLGGLTHVYDGNPKVATATTNPLGLTVDFTYNGSATQPINPGSYAVVATINDANYAGTANGTLVIYATHSLALVSGWNLVSFNLIPASTNITDVLTTVAGNFDLVYVWNAQTQTWLKYDNIPESPDSLSALDETRGFWIHMTAADTLEVVGSIPTTTNIALSANGQGWNLVGYPAATNRNLPTVLTGTNSTLVYAFHAGDTTDPWKLYDFTAAPWSNDLAQLSPGWGYWIKVTSGGTWTVTYP